MKIKRKTKDMLFESLKAGEVFVLDGQSFIKTDKTEYVNAVRLEDGICFQMGESYLVTKIELEANEN